MTNRGGGQSLPGVCSGEIPALVLLNSREKGSVRFLVLGRRSGGGYSAVVRWGGVTTMARILCPNAGSAVGLG